MIDAWEIGFFIALAMLMSFVIFFDLKVDVDMAYESGRKSGFEQGVRHAISRSKYKKMYYDLLKKYKEIKK